MDPVGAAGGQRACAERPETNAAPQPRRIARHQVEALAQPGDTRLLARVRALLGPRARRAADSLDFVQQAWLELLQASALEGSHDDEALLRRLSAIARNNARDAARRRVLPRLESVLAADCGAACAPQAERIMAEQSSPSARLCLRDERVQLERRLAALAPELRAVFELRARQGLSFPQIAARLGRQEDALRKAYYRALRVLQRSARD